ncbi:hypothetical protein CEY12_11310 [Chryseobacterium sp. T16E-39]|uniref:hypothetical protein n=1 Tax=Chryseobacterium sp. T16E-39 TaxID=2015076 RepID=UPI000B5B4102|nr:hypothetical protein [Chryseobacterium sp. T16E-39]ASK32751.1 hypothetical protein CEY12_11310 [Chryseobacterium sp. T16E-39]
MKKIVAICCIVLLWTYFYYPVFDSEGISYLIIFSCFVTLCFSVAKIYSADDKEDYDSVEKEADRLEKFDGQFQYLDNGFYNKQKNPIEFIKWEEIVSVHSFSIPVVGGERQTGLEIITDQQHYEFDRKTPGIEKLKNQLYNHLSDWDLDAPTIITNNYGLKKTKLYERKFSARD